METIPAQTEIGAALDRYQMRDPAASKRLYDLRAGMAANEFNSQLWNEIFDRQASPAVRFAASLLEFAEIAQMVLKRYRQSRDLGIALARKLQISDARFDAAFFKLLSDKHAPGWSRETFLTVLDILDAISERDRLVLAVSKFLKDPDPDTRSKASLFIARRRPTVTWATDISREPHPTVRAHILEGLFDAREDFVHPLFRKYASDEDSRVGANAILGLYHLGDVAAIRLMDEMGKDSRPEFRAAAASIMGQSGDPRFSPNLAKLLSDSDEHVRKNALLALAEVKKATGTARTQVFLRSVLFKRRGEQDQQVVIATVSKGISEPVRGIVPTRFMLKAGGSYVREYKVEEYSCNNPLHAGIVFFEPPKGDNTWSVEVQEKVAEHCTKVRRTRDNLAVANISHETHLRCYASDGRATASILTGAMGDIDFGSPSLNLIVVGITPHTRAVERLVEMAANSGSRCHVIAVAPEWRTPELKRQVQAGGGYFLPAEPVEAEQCCVDVYSSLLHHYRISWEASDGDVELEIRSSEGTAVAALHGDCSGPLL